MEEWAFAFLPGSVGGGARSEKSLVSASEFVISALDSFRLWDDPLLGDGRDQVSSSIWYFCLEPEQRLSVSLAVLNEGSSSTEQEIEELFTKMTYFILKYTANLRDNR